jgi:hypothetical protein
MARLRATFIGHPLGLSPHQSDVSDVRADFTISGSSQNICGRLLPAVNACEFVVFRAE